LPGYDEDLQRLPVCDRPVNCAAVVDYTTSKHKTHKTDLAKVVYRWHPMYGRELLIHGERNRAGAIVVICTVADEESKAVLEIPAWMFDAATCCRFRVGDSASASVDALRSLNRSLQTALDVIEAEHQSITFGGLDAQSQGASNRATGAVSNHDADSAVSTRHQSQNSEPSSPVVAPTRRARGSHGQGSGGLS
jgi:hypothetical protein